MSIDECFRKGMLKRIKPDKNEINNSLDLSRHFLSRATGSMKQKYFDVAFLMAYNSMFQSCRALLFSAGVKERSHYCMIEFVKKEFADDEKISSLAKALDSYRLARHAIQYDGEACDESDAKSIIGDAKEFLDNAVKSLKVHENNSNEKNTNNRKAKTK